MKIVINKCWGGFGLSKEARIELYKLGCEHLTTNTSKPDKFYAAQYDNKNIYDDHNDSDRNCPLLVKVVEELGDKANGDYAKLEIIEIPNNIKWEIDNYDGMESVHEVHQSWY